MAAGDLYRLGLPLEVARQLYECAGKDELRQALYETLLIEAQTEGDREGYRLVATDTHRMFVTFVETLGSLMPPAPGVYRWLTRPTAKCQIVEAAAVEYVNYRRILDTALPPARPVGAYEWKDGAASVTLCKPTRFNLAYLPSIKVNWQWSAPEEPLEPQVLTSGDHIYILMPMQIYDRQPK